MSLVDIFTPTNSGSRFAFPGDYVLDFEKKKPHGVHTHFETVAAERGCESTKLKRDGEERSNMEHTQRWPGHADCILH